MASFIKPYWLDYADSDTVLNRLLGEFNELIPNLDQSEGSITWDLFRPNAMQISRLIQFNLTEACKNMFPQFAYGDFLDYHAEDRLLFRKNPIHAFGSITIKGMPGAVIESGTLVSTISNTEEEAVYFQTLQRVTLDDNGDGEVEIRAVEPGSKGNVGALTIVAFDEGRDDIITIVNENPCSGGADRETDEQLYERIKLYDTRANTAYVGCERDYQLWALEVPGVGSARVQGCEDRDGNGGDGIVYVSITDSQGGQASQRLINEVYNHIASPDDIENKLSAVNSKLVVETPDVLKVDIKAEITLDTNVDFNASIENIENEFKDKVTEYLVTTYDKNKVIRHDIGAILTNIYGVLDYTKLTLNDNSENLPFTISDIPVLGEVTITEGS